MKIKYNKFTSLGSRHNHSGALHQYLNAISDEELFNLRKKVPTIRTIFDDLEKDLVSFIDNHDIENIKNIVFKNCYNITYERALKEKERDADLIDGLLILLKKIKLLILRVDLKVQLEHMYIFFGKQYQVNSVMYFTTFFQMYFQTLN